MSYSLLWKIIANPCPLSLHQPCTWHNLIYCSYDQHALREMYCKREVVSWSLIEFSEVQRIQRWVNNLEFVTKYSAFPFALHKARPDMVSFFVIISKNCAWKISSYVRFYLTCFIHLHYTILHNINSNKHNSGLKM